MPLSPEPTNTAETNGAHQPSDGGSVRPLFIFLVATALTLVGSMAFALVQTGSDRELAQLQEARTDVVRTVDEGRKAQNHLDEQIKTAEKLLTTSQRENANVSIREDLIRNVTAARKLGTSSPPSIPEAGDERLDAPDDVAALSAQATEWATTMRSTSTALDEAIKEVQEGYKKWLKKKHHAEDQASAKQKAAKQLETFTAKLTSVTANLKISVRDSQYTLDWTKNVGALAEVRENLLTHRTEGQTALAADVDPDNLDSVKALFQRREAARLAIEKAAWAARATVADGTNGRLSNDTLCKLGRGPEGQEQYLRCDAAQAWKKLGVEFEATFGKPLRVDYGYRPFDWQLQVIDEFGSGQAAKPGTSEHGWGLAVDVPVDDGFLFGQPEFEWLAAHGPAFGWIHPEWARAGGGREEPWHFEFEG